MAVVAVAIVLRYALDPWLSEVGVPYITFYPAILLATFLGGLGPGLTSLALCTLVAWYIFLPPAFTFELSPQQVFSLVLFVVLGGFDVLLITLLNSALDRIVTHEANIRTLIDAAPNGIVVVDGQGDITLVNPAAEKMLGYSQAQLFGQKIEILVPEPKRNGHGKLREDYMRARSSDQWDLAVIFKPNARTARHFPSRSISRLSRAQAGRASWLPWSTSPSGSRRKTASGYSSVNSGIGHKISSA